MAYYSSHLTIIIPAVLSFLITFFSVRFLHGYFYGAGIIGEDHNKEKATTLPSSGGVAVAFGLIVGILMYTFGSSFVFLPVINLQLLLGAALSIMLITFVGFLDDVNVKGHRVKSTDMMDIRKGLKQWQKPLLTVIGSLPLMALNVGISTVSLPIIGSFNFGILYPLLILPLAVVFVSNAVNLLGGFDGLQPNMTAIASFGLLVYSYLYGNQIGILLSALLFASVLAFVPFNRYRASILPGDSFTYCVGAAFVVIVSMGNAEAFGIVIFIPWIMEFFLHLRRKFKVTDLGIRQRDGTMKAPYGRKIYSLTHLVMNMKRAREEEVTNYLSLLEIIFVLMGFGAKLLGLL